MDTSTIARRLAMAGCVRPEDEAHELVSAAADEESLESLVQRREAGEPLAWIVGATTFCGHRIHVDPGVYVPRPQTEVLARRAAALLPPNGRAADLCTGAGAIAVHLMREAPAINIIATDIDPLAVACAQRNGVAVVRSDLGKALRDRTFDVVTAVAPYVPTPDIPLLPEDVRRHEPTLALDGGADGLAVVRELVEQAARLLFPGGWLLTEVGGDQDTALQPVLDAAGFAPAERWFDEEGDLRGIAVRRP
jgi:release factor glutamine methyltransferase